MVVMAAPVVVDSELRCGAGRVARRDSIVHWVADFPMRKLPSPQVSNRGMALSRNLPARVWLFSGLRGCKPVGL